MIREFIEELNVTLSNKSNKEVVSLLDAELNGLRGALLSELKERQKIDKDKNKLKQEIEKLKVKKGEIETLIAKGKEIIENTFVFRKDKVHDKDVVRLLFHQTPDGNERLFCNHETETNFAFIPGENIMVRAYHNGKIVLFDQSTKNWIKEARDRRVISLQISLDGKKLVTAGDDNIITLWRLPELEIEAELKGCNGRVTCLALTPDGEILVSGDRNDIPYMSEIILWDFEKRKIIKRLKGHGGCITCLAISYDGKMLASGEALGDSENPQPSKIILWDLDKFRMVDVLEEHTGWVESLIFTKYGMLISGDAVGGINNQGNSDIIIWDIQKGMPLAKLKGQDNWVRSLALNDAETILASGGSNGTCMQWNFSKVKKELSLSGIIPKWDIQLAQPNATPRADKSAWPAKTFKI